jgi:hypothetical protein
MEPPLPFNIRLVYDVFKKKLNRRLDIEVSSTMRISNRVQEGAKSVV